MFWKKVLSIVIAIIVGIIFVKLVFFLFKAAMFVLWSLWGVILLAVFAVPVYIIVRRSLFK